jgi:hypothetical protein
MREVWNARVVVVSNTQLGSVNRLRYREVQPNAGTDAALEDEKAQAAIVFLGRG